MNRKNNDFQFGVNEEQRLLEVLKSAFDTTLKMTSRYALFDFEGDEFTIELKSRNSPYRRYPTTMIGANKINFCKSSNKHFIFVFNFTDGVYFWKFNETDLDKFDLHLAGRNDRGKNEVKPYIFIPIEYLTKLEC